MTLLSDGAGDIHGCEAAADQQQRFRGINIAEGIHCPGVRDERIRCRIARYRGRRGGLGGRLPIASTTMSAVIWRAVSQQHAAIVLRQSELLRRAHC